MSQTTVELTNDDPEAYFRRTMAAVADRLWNLRLHHESLSALHDIIDEHTRRSEARENST
jgi:hypothetical protein